MTLQHPTRLALFVALAASATGLSAQPVDPAATPHAGRATTEAASDLDVDRRCLEATGSRLTADPQPATPKDPSEHAGHDCAIGNGTVYTRDDIDRTGRTTVKEALQALDPRVF